MQGHLGGWKPRRREGSAIGRRAPHRPRQRVVGIAKVGQIWPTGRAANVVRRGGLGAIGLPRPPRRTGGRSNAFRRRAAASRNCGVRTARPSKAKSLLIPLSIYRDRFSGALPLTAHQEFSGDGSDAPQRSLRPPRCLEKKPDFASTPLVGSRVRAIHQDAGA